MMRRLALPLVLLLAAFAVTPAVAGCAPGPRAVAPAPSCGAPTTAADLLRLDAVRFHGGAQLACSSGCRRRCRAVYNSCRRRSRDWRRCSAVLNNCLRSCGC